MKAWIAFSTLVLASAPTAAQIPPGDFCADLARIIVAAREAPPFASLTKARLGPSEQCGAIRDESPRFFCVIESRFGEPVDSEGLMARVRQCLGERLSPAPVATTAEQRFPVAGSSGVTLLVDVSGCANCRGGASLSLFIYAPERHR